MDNMIEQMKSEMANKVFEQIMEALEGTSNRSYDAARYQEKIIERVAEKIATDLSRNETFVADVVAQLDYAKLTNLITLKLAAGLISRL